jgi:hypothetical protein
LLNNNLKKKSFSIVTIHKGDINLLKKTIFSVDIQSNKPYRHLVISADLKLSESKKFRKKYISYILGQDNSIYNAMNIGLRKIKKNYLLFLNSGDTFVNSKTIKAILDKLCKKKCYIFKTVLNYKKNLYVPLDNYFFSSNYLAHPSFIMPPSDDKVVLYSDKFNIISDGLWMKHKIKKYGMVKVNKIITVHSLGGISSKPNFQHALENFRVSITSGAKEIIKIILYNLLRKNFYYQLIYSRKFEKK